MKHRRRWIVSSGALLFCGAGLFVSRMDLCAQTPSDQMQARRAVTLLAPEFDDDDASSASKPHATAGFPVKRQGRELSSSMAQLDSQVTQQPQAFQRTTQPLPQRRAASLDPETRNKLAAASNDLQSNSDGKRSGHWQQESGRLTPRIRPVQGTVITNDDGEFVDVTDPPLPGAQRIQPQPVESLDRGPSEFREIESGTPTGPLSANASRYSLPEVGTPYTSSEYAQSHLNRESDSDAWLAPYEDRARRAPVQESTFGQGELEVGLTPQFRGWWEGPITESLRDSSEQLPVNVDLLVTGALEFAPQLIAIRTEPNVRYSRFLAEDAAFDWTAFVESRWDHLNEPVGSTLTTGTNSSRFNDRNYSAKGGVRRKNEYGGQVELSQRIGWQDNNSRFLQPSPQGTTRLELNYTHPLMNGAGVPYNTSRIVLAQIDTNIAHDKAATELQSHLLKVTEAYWELYRARAVFLQRKRLLGSALMIRDTLHGRQDVDAQQRQILRGDAAVASRRSEIIRAAAAIRNAESRLRLLVNDPGILDVGHLELIPEETPLFEYVPLSVSGALQSALTHRPDVSQAIRELRGASVRIGVAENELLPRLDLVLRTYVSGLEGDSNIPQSWGNQFSQGAPSYGFGILYEVPLGNRAAKARYEARKWEYTRAVQEFRAIVETGMTEVELAVREAETSYREMLSRHQALVAAENEAGYLESRWGVFAGDGRGTTLLLEDLLAAQERLADSEGEFVQSQVNYVVALATVRKATGTLLHIAEPMAAPTQGLAPPVGEYYQEGSDTHYGEHHERLPSGYGDIPYDEFGSRNGSNSEMQPTPAPGVVGPGNHEQWPIPDALKPLESTPMEAAPVPELQPIPRQQNSPKPVPVENGPLFEDPLPDVEGPLVPPGPQARASRTRGTPVVPVNSTRTSLRTVFP
ncbi:MAG: TolC family protein [Planctomycetaceae bacterium]